MVADRPTRCQPCCYDQPGHAASTRQARPGGVAAPVTWWAVWLTEQGAGFQPVRPDHAAGSITFRGSLWRNGFEGPVSRLLENVVRRFGA